MMRACLKQLPFILALAAVFTFTHAAKAQALKTNDINLAKMGALQILTPPDWTAKFVGVNQPDQEPMFDLHHFRAIPSSFVFMFAGMAYRWKIDQARRSPNEHHRQQQCG